MGSHAQQNDQVVLVDQRAHQLPEQSHGQDAHQYHHAGLPVPGFLQFFLPALYGWYVPIAGKVVVKQIVGGYAEDSAQPHHILRIRRRGAAFPLADSLTGDGDLLRQTLLAPAPVFSQLL